MARAANPPTDAPPETLGRRMQRAAVWTGLNSFVLRLANFAVGVLVARLVAPEQFGVFAVALVVHSIVINICDIGVSAAIVRADRDIDAIAPTVFTIALISSSMLTALMYFTAPQLASALGAPAATPAIRILSCTVLLGGLTAVPYGILIRQFRQDKRFVADFANFLVSTVAVVILASEGYGATGLAWSKFLGMLISWVLLTVMITPRYWPGWSTKEARAVLGYCLPLAGASIVAFALMNVDSIIVGRVLGPLALGFYALAYNIAGWPVSVFGMMINEVALPAFAHVRRQVGQLPARLSAIFAVSAAVSLPVSALCLGLSRSVVTTVYGPKWLDAAPVLGVLGALGTLRILMSVLTIYLTALGASRAVLTIQLIWIVVLIPALIVGVHLDGIVGAGWSQPLIAILIVFPVAFWFVRRNKGGSFTGLLRACGRPLAGAAAVSAWLLVLHLFTTPGWTQLLLGGFGALALYLVTTGAWLRRHLVAIRSGWDLDEETAAAATG